VKYVFLVAKKNTPPHGIVESAATLASLIDLEIGAAAVLHSALNTASRKLST
jgi:hypothetical protein